MIFIFKEQKIATSSWFPIKEYDVGVRVRTYAALYIHVVHITKYILTLYCCTAFLSKRVRFPLIFFSNMGLGLGGCARALYLYILATSGYDSYLYLI